jgi:tape measure domain-containing protein
MTETARLVIAVDSTQAKAASVELGSLAQTSKATESAVQKLGATGGFTATELGKVQQTSKSTTTDLGVLERATRSTDSAVTKFGSTGASAATQLGKVQQSSKSAATSMSEMGSILKAAAGFLGAAFSVKEVAAAADQYQNLTNRLRLVTEGSAQLASAQGAVFEAAQASRQSLETTASVYQRIAQNGKQLGLTFADVANITETVAKSVALSGASAQAADAALTQFGQALASGALRGDELNSIMEQTPALAQTIARGLGVSIGQLRVMGAEGQLTAEKVIKALTGQKQAVDDLASTMQVTGGQALTAFGNSLTQAIGKLDEATGSSNKFANAVLGISHAIDGFSSGEFLDFFRDNKESVAGLNNEIGTTIARVRDLTAARAKLDPSDASDTTLFNFKFYNREELDAEIAGLGKKADAAREIIAKMKKDAAGIQAQSPKGDAAGSAVNAAYEKELKNLQKMAALQGDNTELAKTRYAIEHGELGKLLPAQEELLLKYAREKDAKAAAEAAAKKYGSAAEKAGNQEAKALESLLSQSSITTTATNSMADAYLAGADNVRELTIQQKIEQELLKTGAGARDAVTAAVNREADAKDRLDVDQAIASLRVENTNTLAQATATLQGASALETFNIQKSMNIALAGKKIDIGSKEYEQLLEQTRAQLDANKALKEAGQVEGIVDRLNPQAKLLKDFTTEQDALNAAIARYPENAALYQDALSKLGKEYEINRNKATLWGQFTEGAIDRIDEAFADMWKSVLSKSGNFMDTLKDSFRQFLAEMLHMAITKPIIVQIGSALGVGGLEASQQGGGLLSGLTGGGGGGIMSYLNTAKNVMSAAGSSFGQSILSGWTSGDGLVGGLQGAFTNGADYLGSAITSAFASGSTTAAQVAGNFAASTTPATVDLIGNTVSVGGQTVGTASGLTTSSAASSLSSLTTALSYVGAVYSVIQSYQDYGIKGAATTAGFAAAGAAIGSVVPVIGTALGAAIGAVIGSFASSKAFGTGEKYPDLSTSATGNYVNGQYNDTGAATTWQRNAPKYGSAADAAMSSTLNKFSMTLGNLYEVLGNGADVVAYNTLQQRKTSGKYSSTFGAQLDDGSVITGKQQFKADDISAALTADYDDIMGTFLAKAIVSSKSLPEYFKAQFQSFANDWDTTADEVIKAIEGVFTRFNGVNDALSLINVGNLNLDNTGLMASDSILDMVGAIGGLDTATATAKEKVDALNKTVGTYYQLFFTADEQFTGLTESLKKSFAGFGLELPDTAPAYRAMVEDIDVTTSAGQAMFATLTGLAENADAYYKEVGKRSQTAIETAKQELEAQQAVNANYYSLFTTDAEKANDKLSDITAQFAAMGVVLPATKDDYKEMVYAASRAGESGKKLYDFLMGMAGNASDAFSIVAQQAETLKANAIGLATSAMSTLQRSIAAQQKTSQAAYTALSTSLNDMLSTASSNVSDLTSVGGELSSALKALRGDSDDAVKMLQAQARATLQSALATAKAGGSLANFAGLSDALDTVGSNNTDLYSTLEDFNRDQGRTANVVAELNAINGKQLTSAEKLQQSLEDQIDRAKDAYDLQSEQFESEQEFAQAQLDALNGLDTSVLTVAAAVAAMNASVVAALGTMPTSGAGSPSANTPANNATLVNSIYKDVLGRDADAAGMAAWTGALQNGASYQDVIAAIKASAAANGQLKVPGFAAGGDFGGGLRLVGEVGPELEVTGPSRIYNASQTAAMLGGGGDKASAAEIRELRREIESNATYMARLTKAVADGIDTLVNSGLQVIGTVSTKAVAV